MKIKYIGSKNNIEKYKSFVKEQEISLEKSKFINYKEKTEGFRILHGELRIKTAHGQQSEKSVSGFHPDEKLYIEGMANAYVEDRMNEIVNPAGCDTTNYVKNMILLSDHMYHSSYAIGLVEELTIESDGVHFSAYIGDPTLGPLTEKQKEIRSLVAQKILKTVSIGFIPKEIIVPEWDEKSGEMISPARIEAWEMLELSIVPIPCNQESTFDIKSLVNDENSLTKNSLFNENVKKEESSVVQTVIFSKEKFTVETAKKWALDHDFKAETADESSDSIRLRQKDPNDFLEESFRTIELTDGIKAVIGRLKDTDAMEEKTAQELVSGIKSMSTLLQTLNANATRSLEMTENLLKKFDEKAAPKVGCDDEDKEDEETTKSGEEAAAAAAAAPVVEEEATTGPKKDEAPSEEEKRFKELDDKIERLAGYIKLLAERVCE